MALGVVLFALTVTKNRCIVLRHKLEISFSNLRSLSSRARWRRRRRKDCMEIEGNVGPKVRSRGAGTFRTASICVHRETGNCIYGSMIPVRKISAKMRSVSDDDGDCDECRQRRGAAVINTAQFPRGHFRGSLPTTSWLRSTVV